MHLYELGGLGNVAYSLPVELNKLNIDCRVCLPFHCEIEEDETYSKISDFEVFFNGLKEKIEIWLTYVGEKKLKVYLLKNRILSQHSGVADDATEKFAFFSLAISKWVNIEKNWKPDLLHLNDWHCSLVPIFLRNKFGDQTKTLLTIHNLNFQGKLGADFLDKCGIDKRKVKSLEWDTQDGDINVLMEGLIHADKINTVSETYAKEILTQEYGANLDPIINSLSGKLSGILNGIDYDTWNPEKDHFVKNFGMENFEVGKQENKKVIYEKFGFDEVESSFLVSYVGRVDHNQKGIELIIDAIEKNLIGNEKFKFVFLGTGDTWLEDKIEELARENKNFAAICKFDEKLAHQLYAGSDFMLIPSKYEPCGLVQMIAMRYGSIPIVRKTGGLADTVIEGIDGFVFEEYDKEELNDKLKYVFDNFAFKDKMRRIRINCLKKDFSWYQSAKKYIKLYQKIINFDL